MNKHRPVYGRGSGEYDNDTDPVRELRWTLFQDEHRHLSREECLAQFKLKFGYKS